MASTHQKYVWGGNRRAVQVQSQLTTRKVAPFYTGESEGIKMKRQGNFTQQEFRVWISLTPRLSGEPAKRDRPLKPLVGQLRIVNWIVPEQTPGAALAK